MAGGVAAAGMLAAAGAAAEPERQAARAGSLRPGVVNAPLSSELAMLPLW